MKKNVLRQTPLIDTGIFPTVCQHLPANIPKILFPESFQKLPFPDAALLRLPAQKLHKLSRVSPGFSQNCLQSLPVLPGKAFQKSVKLLFIQKAILLLCAVLFRLLQPVGLPEPFFPCQRLLRDRPAVRRMKIQLFPLLPALRFLLQHKNTFLRIGLSAGQGHQHFSIEPSGKGADPKIPTACKKARRAAITCARSRPQRRNGTQTSLIEYLKLQSCPGNRRSRLIHRPHQKLSGPGI